MEDIRLSVSKTKTFLDCKRKFNFAYVQKLPKKDWDHHVLGKFCHLVLELFHKELLNHSTESFSKIITKSFKTAQIEYAGKMSPKMTKECFDIIHEYLKIVSMDKKNNQFPNVIAVEKQFELPITEFIVLNGMIDRVQIDDDNVIHVADYKTTKNKKYLKNDWFQLLTYAYVMIQEDPSIKKVRASYILLRHSFEYMTTEFDVPEILSIKDKYIKYAEDISTETDFKPTPTALCSYCDFLNLCPEGKSKTFSNNTYGEVSW